MKIALLCDYGLDDAIATLYVLKNANKFQQIDILPISGNFSLKTSMNNIKRILSHINPLPKNIKLVDTSSIAQHEEFLPEIHGKDGIGDILPKKSNYTGEIMDYNTWIHDLDSSYTIVSLGPCTVTLDILKKTACRSLLLMGGNISEKPNYNEYEFNHGMDIVAFTECVKNQHVIATLDTCHCALCDFNFIKINEDGLFKKMIKRAVQLSNERSEIGCYIYDLITVVFLLHPEKFIKETMVDNFGNQLNVLKYIDDKPLL